MLRDSYSVTLTDKSELECLQGGAKGAGVQAGAHGSQAGSAARIPPTPSVAPTSDCRQKEGTDSCHVYRGTVDELPMDSCSEGRQRKAFSSS